MRLPNSAPAWRRTETAIERFGGLVPRTQAKPHDIVHMRNLAPHAYPALAPAAPMQVINGLVGETQAIYAAECGFAVWQRQEDVDRTYLWRAGASALQEVQTFAEIQDPDRARRGAWFGDRLYLPEQNAVIDMADGASYPIRTLSVKCEPVLDYEPPVDSEYLQPGIGIRFPYGMPRYYVGQHLRCSYTRGGEFYESVICVERIDGEYLYADMRAMEPVNEIDAASITVRDTLPEGLQAIFRSGDRLWGFRGDRIWGTARNAPSCWMTAPHTALADNAFTAGAPNVGRLLAGIDFCGEPVFFGTEGIIRLAGDSPEDWRTVSITGRGLEQGSIYSPATVGDTLFYLSPEGMCALRSGRPKLIAGISPEPLYGGIGGSDGRSYILQARDLRGDLRRFRYDLHSEGVYCEDPVSHVQLVRVGSACLGIREGRPVVLGGVELSAPLLDAMRASGVFTFTSVPAPATALFGTHRPDAGVCTPTRLTVRAAVAAGGTLHVGIRYGEGEDAPVERRTLKGPLAASTHCFALRRRATTPYALFLEGEGDWRVFGVDLR